MDRRKRKRGCGVLCLLLAAAAGAVLFGCRDSIAALLRAQQEKIMETAALEDASTEDGGQEQAGAGEGSAVSGEPSGTEKYYFQQLDEREREVYGKIRDGLLAFQEEIELEDASTEEIDRLYGLVMKDYPEIFWCDGAGSVVTSSASFGLSGRSAALRPEYNCSEEEKEERRSRIEAEADQCLSGIDSQAGDYDKILYVYEYVIGGVEYDLSAPDNQNIYSVFVGRRSVCAGYAKAVQYLLERLGVFCTYVSGTAVSRSGEGGHAWNLVRCEGQFCYVDATWGDPVYLQEGREEDQEAQESPEIAYDYLCCDDTQLFRTHTPDSDQELPACSTMAYNYYVVNGMYYETYDPETILQAMNRSIAAGEGMTVLKFSGPEVYREAREEVLTDLADRAARNLAHLYGIGTVRYSYRDDDSLDKITMYWDYE